MPGHSCTVLGGLPAYAECSFGVDDSPVCGREYWSEVDKVFWLKRDGTKGAEFSEAMYGKLEKYDEYWQADVTEQVSEALAYEAWEAKQKVKHP